jgi:hypothetical protein
MAVRPILDAEAPAFAHGETVEKPIPARKARSASDKAAATKAPAMTAAQDTPDEWASFVRPASPAVLKETMQFFIHRPQSGLLATTRRPDIQQQLRLATCQISSLSAT